MSQCWNVHDFYDLFRCKFFCLFEWKVLYMLQCEWFASELCFSLISPNKFHRTNFIIIFHVKAWKKSCWTFSTYMYNYSKLQTVKVLVLLQLMASQIWSEAFTHKISIKCREIHMGIIVANVHVMQEQPLIKPYQLHRLVTFSSRKHAYIILTP